MTVVGGTESTLPDDFVTLGDQYHPVKCRHLLIIGDVGPDLGLLTMFLYPMRERESFIDLLEAVSGGRLLYSYMRIGGVRNPIPPNFEVPPTRPCRRVASPRAGM